MNDDRTVPRYDTDKDTAPEERAIVSDLREAAILVDAEAVASGRTRGSIFSRAAALIEALLLQRKRLRGSPFGSKLRVANIERHREWWIGVGPTLAFRGVELAGEAGEACNVIKKLEREALGLKGSRATVEQLADELADVVICVDLIAMDMKIDLDHAVAAKFNKTSKARGLATMMDEG